MSVAVLPDHVEAQVSSPVSNVKFNVLPFSLVVTFDLNVELRGPRVMLAVKDVCEKIISSMPSPRICLAEFSPMTHLIASTIFDFPHPLGPTTPVKPLLI